MGCVRKRGKSWNAQVRIAGWRSFTKSFKSKSDTVCWVQQTEHQLKNTSLPVTSSNHLTLYQFAIATFASISINAIPMVSTSASSLIR